MLQTTPEETKETVFDKVGKWLHEQRISIESTDNQRPWGGFYVIEDDSLPTFMTSFFPEQSPPAADSRIKLMPKILLVAPHQRLSWQYHQKRSELWRVVKGPVGAIISDTDEQGPVQTFPEGEMITLAQSKRHRLVGLDNWGIIAEMWIHTDKNDLSSEEDIVRIEDDFGRED